MSYIILIFAVSMLAIGVIILIKPMAIFGLMNNYSQSLKLHVFAVLIRLFLGVVFIASSQNLKFPLALEIIGWFFIVVGIMLAVIGRNNFKKLIEWAMTLVPTWGRFSGVLAMLLGGFLGYSAL